MYILFVTYVKAPRVDMSRKRQRGEIHGFSRTVLSLLCLEVCEVVASWRERSVLARKVTARAMARMVIAVVEMMIKVSAHVSYSSFHGVSIADMSSPWHYGQTYMW